jgi:hypothetical protein
MVTLYLSQNGYPVLDSQNSYPAPDHKSLTLYSQHGYPVLLDYL